MSPALLREIGEAYPGGQRGLAQWLAERRGSNPESVRKTLQRAENGTCPPWLWPEVRAALQARRHDLAELLRRLPRV